MASDFKGFREETERKIRKVVLTEEQRKEISDRMKGYRGEVEHEFSVSK